MKALNSKQITYAVGQGKLPGQEGCVIYSECVSEKERKEALLKAGTPSPSTLCKL